MNVARVVTAGSVLAAGVGTYMINDSSKGNDVLGALLVTGGVYGTLIGGTRMGANAINSARAAGTVARPSLPMAVTGAAAAGTTIGTWLLAGGGKARPVETVDGMVKRHIEQGKVTQGIGGGEAPDGAKIRDYIESFDKYDQHGARAGDGTLTKVDAEAFRKDWEARASATRG